MVGEHPPGSGDLSPAETERVRERVRLMLDISARTTRFRGGILHAAARLTPQEAAIAADLERHGLDVTQLRDLLHGAHVLVDQPELYERWLFPDKSHQRISSHHPEIDSARIRTTASRPGRPRKLHGRTAHGTGSAQEDTSDDDRGQAQASDVTDLKHVADYMVYRITRSDVGPWDTRERRKTCDVPSPDLASACRSRRRSPTS